MPGGVTAHPKGNEMVQACFSGDLEAAQKLLQEGVPVNATDKDQNTGLGAACCGGHLPLVRLLLEKTANPGLKNNIGTSAVWLASGYGHDSVLSLLLESEQGRAQLNECNKAGDSPLLAAVSRSHLKIAQVLLEAGADVNLVMRTTRTFAVQASLHFRDFRKISNKTLP